MNPTSWRAVLWPAGLVLVLLDLTFAVYVLVRTPAGVPAGQRPSYIDAVLMLGALEFLFVGFIIARRQSRNVIGWLLLVIGILLPLSNVANYYPIDAKYAPGAFPASGLVLAVGVVLEQPGVGPSDHELSRVPRRSGTLATVASEICQRLEGGRAAGC